MAQADLGEWVRWREQLEKLPANLQGVARGIVEDTAKVAAAEVRSQYRGDLIPPEETGRLVAGVEVREVSPMHWRVLSADGKAYWWEFGTAMRQTRTGANRGQMSAHPTVIPTAIRFRRAMVERLRALMESAGFTVSGDASGA
jgi:hypothetical protein